MKKFLIILILAIYLIFSFYITSFAATPKLVNKLNDAFEKGEIYGNEK